MSYGADWTCAKCGWANLDFRTSCRNCHEPSPRREAVAVTATLPHITPPPLALSDIERLKMSRDDISEATAHAILAMIKAAGPASVMPHEFVPKATIVITCHPDVYAHVRRMTEASHGE